LRGMLEKLKKSCKERNIWTIKDENEAKFKSAARFLGNLANQVISNQTGLNVKEATDGVVSSSKTNAEIAEIKALITDLITELVKDPKNPIQKVVFFVDDLDRIPPGDAVEVLEALKNIFDIPYCVFILAIDYDVVVKGLESKFGKKTEENEREFRSFFDKIIQVPFSMPIGTYDIENFLIQKLISLDIKINDEEKVLYTKAVKFSIGYNPRSLKRYLNSFSLINQLKDIDKIEGVPQGNDFMLFALLGIQISFPKIFRLLSQKINFTEWDRGFANKFGIDWDDVQEKIKKFGESDLIDEEWEQVTWGACQNDSYLKSRAFSVIELLNVIRERFQHNLEDELELAMAFASITSVDDDIETKQAVQKVGNKTIYSGIESKIQQLKDEGFVAEAVTNFGALWNILSKKMLNNSKFRISFAKSGCGFYDDSKGSKGKNQLVYCTNPSKKMLGMKFYLKSNTGLVDECFEKYGSKYKLFSSESFFIDNDKDLIFEPNLYEILGQDNYRNLLTDIANEIN
jgi:hypothetical protein